MDFRDTPKRKSQMTVVRQEPRLDIGDFACQPLPVRDGNHLVMLAVHEQNGNSNLTQFETPRSDKRDVIIDAPVSALTNSLVNGAEHKTRKVGC